MCTPTSYENIERITKAKKRKKKIISFSVVHCFYYLFLPFSHFPSLFPFFFFSFYLFCHPQRSFIVSGCIPLPLKRSIQTPTNRTTLLSSPMVDIHWLCRMHCTISQCMCAVCSNRVWLPNPLSLPSALFHLYSTIFFTAASHIPTLRSTVLSTIGRLAGSKRTAPPS